jgi:1-acyl-sn-glycerol-3-phosphate acyltransferase
MNFRAARRTVTLGFALAVSLLRLGIAHLRGPMTVESRALWLQSMGRLVLSSLGIRATMSGEPPATGLVVSNHLSYLDVAIYVSIFPCTMVAKAELSRWPVFGLMARSSGTMFVDRSSRASAVAVTKQVAERLKSSLPVLFFPEGTSTDGRKVLRFHSRLFTPAAEAGVPVTSAAVRYVIEDGTPERELCWFGDTLLLPHMWKALGTAGFCAEVYFGQPQVYRDRRSAADQTYAEITAWRNSGRGIKSQEEMQAI